MTAEQLAEIQPWRCDSCVELKTLCLFGDPGCPYRNCRKPKTATDDKSAEQLATGMNDDK